MTDIIEMLRLAAMHCVDVNDQSIREIEKLRGEVAALKDERDAAHAKADTAMRVAVERKREAVQSAQFRNEAIDRWNEIVAERDAAVKAMSGWSGSGYRDGYYVDDIGEYFQPFIDAAQGEK